MLVSKVSPRFLRPGFWHFALAGNLMCYLKPPAPPLHFKELGLNRARRLLSPPPAAPSVPWLHPKAFAFSSGSTGVSQQAGRDRLINASQLNELCALCLAHSAAEKPEKVGSSTCLHQLCVSPKGGLALPPHPVIFPVGLCRKDPCGSAHKSQCPPLFQTPCR